MWNTSGPSRVSLTSAVRLHSRCRPRRERNSRTSRLVLWITQTSKSFAKVWKHLPHNLASLSEHCLKLVSCQRLSVCGEHCSDPALTGEYFSKCTFDFWNQQFVSGFVFQQQRLSVSSEGIQTLNVCTSRCSDPLLL